jgi:hypothetical protein
MPTPRSKLTSRSVRRTWIKSRTQYVDELIRREPALAKTGLTKLENLAIDRRDDADAFYAVNSLSMTEAVVRVLSWIATRADLDVDLVPTLVKTLTADKTTIGYAAQIQGYDWLLRQGASFTPEVKHIGTMRRKKIPLDGRFDVRHGGAFFDIKSYAFEPGLRAVFKRRLETLIGGKATTIDGPGNHAPDAIREHASGRLKGHGAALGRGEVVHIRELDWTVRVHLNARGVTTSEASYKPAALAHEHRLMPLWYGSQFTTDSAYILLFVLPYGFGEVNPFAIDVFGSTIKLIDGIAAHVFGPARIDASPANADDRKMPIGVTIANAVANLSGMALLSEPGADQPTIARIHLNCAGAHPLTGDQVRSISSSWCVSACNFDPLMGVIGVQN